MAVLVAIAIPVFTNQLEKAREATDMANIRSAYGEVTAEFLEDSRAHSATVKAKQTQQNWLTTGSIAGVKLSSINTNAKNGGSFKIAVTNSGKVTIDGVETKAISVS